MLSNKEIPQWKIDEVENILGYFQKHDNVAIIKVAGINDRQIQATRKLLRGKAIMKMSKKNLQKRAIEKYAKESKKENLDILIDNIPGQAMMVFTDMDIFELKRIFEENKWMVPAKPDEFAPVDIWVPAGDTGLPTGQVISELNMTLKLPTKIQNDTIWIREDTRTHKAGDFVNIKQASVLKKLGVKPIESIIKLSFAWTDGEIMSEDVIYMDLEKFREDVASAYATARTLAIELGVIDDDTIKPLIQKGYRQGLQLLFEMPIFDESMASEYMKRAATNANLINALILGEGVSAGPVPEETKSEPEPEEEEEEEEESPGIGGLFG